MLTKKMTKEALYFLTSIMHHLSCLVSMGEDSGNFLKGTFLDGKKNSVTESRKHTTRNTHLTAINFHI